MVFVADIVFVLHGIFVLAVVPSTLLALFGVYASYPSLWKFHNTCLVFVLLGQVVFGRCILVVLEAQLRYAGGSEMPYTGGFTRYVFQELTGVLLPPRFVMAVTALLILSSIAAVALHWRSRGSALLRSVG